MAKFKLDVNKLLPIGVTILGVAGSLLSSKVEKNNREEMKNKLKEEILKEITSNNSQEG